jgi:hypothetical protein
LIKALASTFVLPERDMIAYPNIQIFLLGDTPGMAFFPNNIL